jgi:hypothetical protein
MTKVFDYVEGFVIINSDNPYNGWKSVPFSPEHINNSMIPKDAGSVMYYIELTKGFDFINIHVTEQVCMILLKLLSEGSSSKA